MTTTTGLRTSNLQRRKLKLQMQTAGSQAKGMHHLDISRPAANHSPRPANFVNTVSPEVKSCKVDIAGVEDKRYEKAILSEVNLERREIRMGSTNHNTQCKWTCICTGQEIESAEASGLRA